MNEEYTIDVSYQEARYKTILAILQSQFGIEVNDFDGMIQVKKDGKLIASVEINQKNI